MAVLVTGGTGVVGIHVVRALCEAGEVVVSLSRGGADERYRRYLGGLAPEAAFASGDARNPDDVARVMKDYRVEGVVHAAGITTEAHALADPLHTFSINVTGTATVLEAARVHGVKRFIYVGSSSEYGPRPDLAPIGEDEVRVEGLYAETKHLGHRLAQRYRQVFGLDVLTVRVSSVYGPFTRPDTLRGFTGNGLIMRACEAIALGRDIVVPADAGDVRGWTYGADAGAGIALTYRAGSPSHDTYNIASGTSYTVAEVVSALQSLSPTTSVTIAPKAAANPSQVATIRGPLDISRARTDFGYEPVVSLHDGLSTYISWMRAEKVEA